MQILRLRPLLRTSLRMTVPRLVKTFSSTWGEGRYLPPKKKGKRHAPRLPVCEASNQSMMSVRVVVVVMDAVTESVPVKVMV
jgi:hypothetical protein